MSNITSPTGVAAPTSPRPTSQSSKGSQGTKPARRKSLADRAKIIVQRLRGTANTDEDPTILRFHRKQGDNDLYQATFTGGSRPKRGSETTRACQTLGRLVTEAEACNGTNLHITAQGAWVELESGGTKCLEVEGLRELMAALQRADSPIDMTEDAPPPPPESEKPMPSAVSPPAPSLINPAQSRRHADAKRFIENARERWEAMRAGKDVSGDAIACRHIGRALQVLRGDNSEPAVKMWREALLLKVHVLIDAKSPNMPLPAERAEEALKLCAEVLKKDNADVSAYMVRGRVLWAANNRGAALDGYIMALQAYQTRNNLKDAPAAIDALPYYEAAPLEIYRSIKALLPDDVPLTVNQALLTHINQMLALERQRRDPPVRDGDSVPGPCGGSAKNKRPQGKKGEQTYYIQGTPNATLGRKALSIALEWLHDNITAQGFPSSESDTRIERACGFNRLRIRRDGVKAIDLDDDVRDFPSEGGPQWLTDLCYRLPPDATFIVAPELQGVRSEIAETYLHYTQTWEADELRIDSGNNAYVVPVGLDAVVNPEDHPIFTDAVTQIGAAARHIASILKYEGQRFDTVTLDAQTLRIKPRLGDVPPTPEMRAKTRAYLDKHHPPGINAKGVLHLWDQIRLHETGRFDEENVQTFTSETATGALSAPFLAAQKELQKIAALLPDGKLTISMPAPNWRFPRAFNKSGCQLWWPVDPHDSGAEYAMTNLNAGSIFRLINQELYIRQLGQMHVWGDQFEAKLLRDLGLNVRIWQTVRDEHGAETPWKKFRTNALELNEGGWESDGDDSKPMINVLRVNEIHYVTLVDVQIDEKNPRLGKSKKIIDNPGGGDCLYYSSINGAIIVCPKILPESVRGALGSDDKAKPNAVGALRNELQKLTMRKLDESADFEGDLSSHLHPRA